MKFPTGRIPLLTKNKGSQQAKLPSRRAMMKLMGLDPMKSSMGNYAKMTPSGFNADVGNTMEQGQQPIPALTQTDDE